MASYVLIDWQNQSATVVVNDEPVGTVTPPDSGHATTSRIDIDVAIEKPKRKAAPKKKGA